VTAVRHREQGFTLIEVMVALMIFGMIAAAGVAILSFSIRAQAASGERLDDGAAVARTLSILSADLAQATARIARDEGGLPRPAFLGESNSLQFVRGGWSNIDNAPRASVQKVGWAMDGENLTRIGYPQLDGAAPLPATPMLSGIRALAIRYRFGGAWSDRWDGAGGIPLPQAVELRVDRMDGRQYRAMFLVGTGYVANAPAQAGNAN
jgi:general secretion pathway protein J